MGNRFEAPKTLRLGRSTQSIKWAAMALGDIHYTHTPPASRTQTYMDEIWTTLTQAGNLARDRQCRNVLLTGDILHSKSKHTPDVLLKLSDLFSRAFAQCEVYANLGNHDWPPGSGLATIRENSNYGVLERMGAFTGYRADLEWARDTETGTMLVHVPYCSVAEPGMLKYHADRVGSLRHTLHTNIIVVLHHDWYQSQVEEFGDRVKATGYANVIVCNGHLHDQQYMSSRRGTVAIGLGTLSRTSIAQAELRPYAFFVGFDRKGHSVVEAVQLPQLPKSDAFHPIDITKTNVIADSVLDFVRRVPGQDPTVLTLMALVDSIGKHIGAFNADVLVAKQLIKEAIN